jgi:hypothetical protein
MVAGTSGVPVGKIVISLSLIKDAGILEPVPAKK